MKAPKRIAGSSLLLLAALTSPVLATQDSGAAKQDFDVILDPLISERRLPGYYVAVFKNGEKEFEQAQGFADERNQVAPDSATLYAIESMTEPLTATALMVLVEMGKLSLDDPLAKYLPEFGAMKVANNGSMSSMQEAQRQISLRNLLSHQAGLTSARRYAFDLNDVQKLYRKRGLFSKDSQLTDLGEHVSALAELPLVYQPGSRTADSVAYDVLARVVEVVADKPFEEFLNAQVLKPLAMRDTHFEVPESKRDRLAAMYEPVVWGYNVPGTPKMYRRSIVTSKKQAESGEAREAFIGGSTGLLSTASDYAKFLAFLLGEQTASAVTLSEENRRAVLYGTNNLTANTNRQTTDLGTMAGQGLGYRFKIGSSNTSFWIDPETRIAGLFLTQLNPAQFELVPLLQEAADRHFSNPL